MSTTSFAIILLISTLIGLLPLLFAPPLECESSGQGIGQE